MENNKCRFCGEPINTKAKKCPHCHGWQSKWKFSIQNPIPLLLIIAVFSLFISMIDTETRYFWKNYTQKFQISFDEALKITDSSLKKYACGEKQCLKVFAEIENSSNYVWDSVCMYVELYDSKNELISTISDREFDFIIPANSKTVYETGYSFEGEYYNKISKHKVFIRFARIER